MSKPEKVKPILIHDPETNEVKYTLEFNRRSIAKAEANKFVLSDVTDYLSTKPAELFYYAFLMHHPMIQKRVTDRMWFGEKEDYSDGLCKVEGLLARLIDLYSEPIRAMYGEDGEGEEKNEPMYTVTL